MDFDEETQDLSLYLKELKQTEQCGKMHAVARMQSVASILCTSSKIDYSASDNAFKTLLLGVIEIIEDVDNESEFLVTLAEQISLIKPYISPSLILLLAYPLEIMLSMEEPSVRNKAIESLLQVAKDGNMKIINN